MARKARKTRKQSEDDQVVSPFAQQHADYGSAVVVDLDGSLGGKRQSMLRVLRNLYPSVVDRWLAEGGPGFDEPQRRAIDHCRSLWNSLGTQRLVANYAGSIPGESGNGNEAEVFARLQLAEYENEIPHAYWSVFEAVVRFDMPAGTAGSHLARNQPQRIAAARTTVGFVASKIAEWRNF